MRVVRSAHAHGRIVAIDAQAARAADGVIAVWTAADVADISADRFQAHAHRRTGALSPADPRYGPRPLCREPVAVVFAADPYLAEDAADLVTVEIELLPGIARGRRAARRICRRPFHRSRHRAQGYGDVTAAFASAHAVIALELKIGRHSGVPLETRGAIARFDAARNVLEMFGAAKVPHWNRDSLARMLRPRADFGATA